MPLEEYGSIGTLTTVLLTFKTEHAEYDALIITDLNTDPVFREVPLDYKDARNKSLKDIFGYDPAWELKSSQRVLFRDVIENSALPPSQWAIFARIQKGVPRQQRNDICRTLSAIIRKYRGEERRHYFIKQMVNNWLEKVAKDFNYPQRDPVYGKFTVTKFGMRNLRGSEVAFPRTDSEAGPSPKQGRGRGASKSPFKPSVSGVRKRSPLKKVVRGQTQPPSESFSRIESVSLTQPSQESRDLLMPAENVPSLHVETRISPRKTVTQPSIQQPSQARGLELLTSSRTEGEAQHRSPIVSPIPVEVLNKEHLRIFANDLLGRISEMEVSLAHKQQQRLTEFCMASLPEVINKAVDDKIREIIGPMEASLAEIAKVTNTNEARLLTLVMIAKESKKTNEAVTKQLNKVQDNQLKYERRLSAIVGVAAETRGECTDLIAKVLPFRFVGRAFDICISADVFRKYAGFFIQPKLDSMAQDNIMNCTAHIVVNTFFTPIASSHLAFGDTQTGASKMHYYRRAMPKAFADFVMSHVVQYVRRAHNISASTKLENYAKCHGGIQIKFSNDRQKVVKVAAENCPTSTAALDALYEMDEQYIADMMFAIPKEVRRFNRAKYNSIHSKVREMKALIDAESRGAAPPQKAYPRPENIFESLYRDAGITMDDRDAFEFIATLAKTAKINPRSVKFQGCQWIPNVQETYDELLKNGMLDLDAATKKYNISRSEEVQAPIIEDDDDVNYDEQLDEEEPETTGKRKGSSSATPAKKRTRASTTRRSLNKAEKEGRVLRLQDKSTTRESTVELDDDDTLEEEAEAEPLQGERHIGMVVLHDDTNLQESLQEQEEVVPLVVQAEVHAVQDEEDEEVPENPNAHLLTINPRQDNNDVIDQILFEGQVEVINQDEFFEAMGQPLDIQPTRSAEDTEQQLEQPTVTTAVASTGASTVTSTATPAVNLTMPFADTSAPQSAEQSRVAAAANPTANPSNPDQEAGEEDSPPDEHAPPPPEQESPEMSLD